MVCRWKAPPQYKLRLSRIVYDMAIYRQQFIGQKQEMQYAGSPVMTLTEKIHRAFADRKKPAEVVDVIDRAQIDSDVEDTLWFAGRDWRDITWKDWEEHYVATSFFSKDAFAYYLPSLLLLSLQEPKSALLAADSLISALDRTPSTEGWNDLFVEHFLGLRFDEYEVMKEWLLQLCLHPAYKGCGNAGSGPGDRFGRAYDTLALLQQESLRR